jgi:transcriptional regulator with XRE-family HTH domain
MEASEQHSNFGEVLRRLRQEAGLSQAGLAGAAGTSLRQIHRYERGEQQPPLDVGQRLAAALDELAGGSTDRVKLDCTWWAAWQTFNDGQQVIATQSVGLSQHGATVQIEALERSAENEQAATSGAFCLKTTAMVLDLHPIGSSRASSRCLCTGRDASGQVALPWVVARRAPHRHRLRTPAFMRERGAECRKRIASGRIACGEEWDPAGTSRSPRNTAPRDPWVARSSR